MKPTLVLTRPEPQSRVLAEIFQAQANTIIAPVLEIVASEPPPDLTPYSGVVLTSANALAFLPALRGKRAYCVGSRTAQAAHARGAQVCQVAKNADDLVAHFDGAGPLIHMRGEHARGDVAKRLNSAGIETVEKVIYRQLARAISPPAKAAIESDEIVVLPLYSPRSARLVGEQVARVGNQLRVIAMSDAVAKAWQSITAGNAEVVPYPTGEEMLIGIRSALQA